MTGATYNALGQLASLALNNGVTTAYTYQSGTFRLQRVQAGNLLDLEYGYDAVGNVTQLLDRRNGVTEALTFGYDALDRLVSAQAAGIAELAYTQVFTYNAIGNLTAKSDIGLYTYPASGESSVRPHAVTGTSNGWDFGYDDNGNMITRAVTAGTYQLSYTWENRLAAITETTSMAVTRYVYDADGVLVKKVAPEGSTQVVNGLYEVFPPDAESSQIPYGSTGPLPSQSAVVG